MSSPICLTVEPLCVLIIRSEFDAKHFIKYVLLVWDVYHAQNYVYGWWDNHSPSGAAIGHSLYNDNYAWVRSKKERDALKFIQQAISDFNGNYGSEYNITAVIAADIYEQ